jgi:hypothetical protein
MCKLNKIRTEDDTTRAYMQRSEIFLLTNFCRETLNLTGRHADRQADSELKSAYTTTVNFQCLIRILKVTDFKTCCVVYQKVIDTMRARVHKQRYIKADRQTRRQAGRQ